MQVKVVNLDDKEYQEIYKDELIVIPPGGYHEMGRADAIHFLGQFSPMIVDGQGRALKPKKLRIVEDPEQHAAHRGQPMRADCIAPDGKEFRTKAGFDAYMEKMENETKNPTPEVDNGPRRRRRNETGR